LLENALVVTLDKEIRIQAPPDRVFAWVGTLVRHPRWMPGTLAAYPTVPGDLRRGSRLHLTLEALGLRFESEAETLLWEPGRAFGWRQRVGDLARHEARFEVTPDGSGGSRVRARIDVELPFVLPRLATEAEIAAELSGKLDRGLLNLRDLAEGRPIGAGGVAGLRWARVSG